jgi:hypothetical protein
MIRKPATILNINNFNEIEAVRHHEYTNQGKTHRNFIGDHLGR